MDEARLLELGGFDAYGSLGLDPDPELGFAGVRALRQLADFCESYQVRRLRESGHSWGADRRLGWRQRTGIAQEIC
jgi:hypothetical protein